MRSRHVPRVYTYVLVRACARVWHLGTRARLLFSSFSLCGARLCITGMCVCVCVCTCARKRGTKVEVAGSMGVAWGTFRFFLFFCSPGNFAAGGIKL